MISSHAERLQRALSIMQTRHPDMGTLYGKYGGIKTVEKIIAEFYQEILSRETLAHYFSNTDVDRLISHQVQFLSYLLGGPVKYEEKSLKDIHAHFKISIAVFDEVVEILSTALKNAGMSEDDVHSVLLIVSGAKSSIVSDAEMALS